MVLRQLRQLQVPQVRGQCEAAALQDHGQVQSQEDQHRLHKQRLLLEYPESTLLRLFHAGRSRKKYFSTITDPLFLFTGCAFREDWTLSHREGQPGGPAAPQHVPGPQA